MILKKRHETELEEFQKTFPGRARITRTVRISKNRNPTRWSPNIDESLTLTQMMTLRKKTDPKR